MGGKFRSLLIVSVFMSATMTQAQSPVLDIETVLPGGLTPGMSMQEAEATLIGLGFEPGMGMRTKPFSISTGLPDQIQLPDGSVLSAYNSTHDITLAPDIGDTSKVGTITGLLFRDDQCLARLKENYGQPSRPCNEGSFLRGNACAWSSQDGSYSINAAMRGHHCSVQFKAS